MTSPRKSLYERLPEIYRIKDAEQFPTRQLKAYLDVLNEVPACLHDNIEALYHDQFIDTCADWVVPYIADLLGTSYLSGDPWTLRADVARTVFYRRRKGTLGAVESLVFTLSGWAVQAVELRNNLALTQHLNHQRPDVGGAPPLQQRSSLAAPVRGGTLPIRDPAALSFLFRPFDPFAHVADVKPGQVGAPRYNIPNLGVFIWRLEEYTVPVADPGFIEALNVTGTEKGDAAAVVRVILHPQADPMVLFNKRRNKHRSRMEDESPNLSYPDEMPGPIPWPRLISKAEYGNPSAYVRVDHYVAPLPKAPGDEEPALVLHLPDRVQPPGPPDVEPSERWRFRGANLCAWEDGLSPPLREYEIVIDPRHGRVLFGLASHDDEADPLAEGLFASYTYGYSGPTGAHPISREPLPHYVSVDRSMGVNALETELANLGSSAGPLTIEIQDSATYELDLASVDGIGGTEEISPAYPSLLLAHPLTIRAATGQRPVVRLKRPLRFGPSTAAMPADIADLSVTLEGLYVTWDRDSTVFSNSDVPLITRSALNLLRIEGCTLDPGGAWQLHSEEEEGSVQDTRPSFTLGGDYGFDVLEVSPFRDHFKEAKQIPHLELIRSVCGAVLAEGGAYTMAVTDSLIDAGSGVGDSTPKLAIGPSNPASLYGPALKLSGLTCFGRVYVERVTGEGGIFLHTLEAHDNQSGCVRFSYFSGVSDRLPPHYGYVFGTEADIAFVGDRFGMPGYGQLRRRSDSRILEQGPGRDMMGTFGYLRNTHKWKNINIRFREFMPVGIRPILIPVT